MKNKSLFEEWLNSFKKNINGKKFKSVKPYLNYISRIESIMGMRPDAIYKLSSTKSLKALEADLRKNKDFKVLSEKYQYNLLSGLHVYQDLIEVLTIEPVKK